MKIQTMSGILDLYLIPKGGISTYEKLHGSIAY